MVPSLQGEQEAQRRSQVTALQWQLPHPCCPRHRSKDVHTVVECGVPFTAGIQGKLGPFGWVLSSYKMNLKIFV